MKKEGYRQWLEAQKYPANTPMSEPRQSHLFLVREDQIQVDGDKCRFVCS